MKTFSFKPKKQLIVKNYLCYKQVLNMRSKVLCRRLYLVGNFLNLHVDSFIGIYKICDS